MVSKFENLSDSEIIENYKRLKAESYVSSNHIPRNEVFAFPIYS